MKRESTPVEDETDLMAEERSLISASLFSATLN